MKNISLIFVLRDIYDCVFQVHSQLGRVHVCFHTLNEHSHSLKVKDPCSKTQRCGRKNITLTWGKVLEGVVGGLR